MTKQLKSHYDRGGRAACGIRTAKLFAPAQETTCGRCMRTRALRAAIIDQQLEVQKQARLMAQETTMRRLVTTPVTFVRRVHSYVTART